MKTKGVSSAILSAVHAGIVDQLAAIAKRPFDGASIQVVEDMTVSVLTLLFIKAKYEIPVLYMTRIITSIIRQ